MTHEEIYEKVMGHKPITDGTKGMFDWGDIVRIMKEAQQQVKSVDVDEVVELFSDYLSEELKKYEGMKVIFNHKK